jgi:hypothetical protein
MLVWLEGEATQERRLLSGDVAARVGGVAVDKYRDVMIKVVIEDREHCSTECQYLEGDGTRGMCIFGSLAMDKTTGTFSRHCECCMSER